MLAIRMQRTGRKGHAMFRVIVQDSRVTPTSGKIVALLGNYDPHAKTAVLDKEKAAEFLKNGAQPSDRAALLLKKEGVKLPKWVSVDTKKAGKLRNAEKLRRNRPAGAAAPEAPSEETPAEEAVVEAAELPADEVTETPAENPSEQVPDASAENTEVAEAPAEPEQTAEPEKPAEETAAPETEESEKEETKKA